MCRIHLPKPAAFCGRAISTPVRNVESEWSSGSLCSRLVMNGTEGLPREPMYTCLPPVGRLILGCVLSWWPCVVPWFAFLSQLFVSSSGLFSRTFLSANFFTLILNHLRLSYGHGSIIEGVANMRQSLTDSLTHCLIDALTH